MRLFFERTVFIAGMSLFSIAGAQALLDDEPMVMAECRWSLRDAQTLVNEYREVGRAGKDSTEFEKNLAGLGLGCVPVGEPLAKYMRHRTVVFKQVRYRVNAPIVRGTYGEQVSGSVVLSIFRSETPNGADVYTIIIEKHLDK